MTRHHRNRRRLLTGPYTPALVRRALLPLRRWQPFPPAADRAAWRRLSEAPLNRRRRQDILRQARALLGRPWPALPATLYMAFCRTGDRKGYETPYFERRQRLAVLALAECFERRGRFLDELANGLWLLLGEPTWCIPAHAARYPDSGDPLPRPDLQSVDLFACETAMLAAELGFLLKAELEALSPSLAQRLRQAVLERVVVPVETRTDLWWIGGRNNWNPWCSSNTLGAAMYTLDNPARLARLAWKLMCSADVFLAGYGDDGGCDEGPGYWGVAAGALLMFLELLHSRSNGRIALYGDPLVRRMGHFIVDAHLAGPWFMNFADAPARPGLRRAVTFQYGRRIGDRALRDLALLSARGWRQAGPVRPPWNQGACGGDLMAMLRELFWMPAGARPRPLRYPPAAWYPDLQVLIARQDSRDGKGLVLAAKAGHNAESHNHNDVGQFILCHRGAPLVVDLGAETYTRRTFGPDRYTLWFTRSAGHNVPLVNGVEQKTGAAFKAGQVDCRRGRTGASLSMNLENAYPPEAGLKSLRRTLTLDRGRGGAVRVRDEFAMAGGPPHWLLPLFSPGPVRRPAPGRLLLGEAGRGLVLSYPPDLLDAQINPVPLKDGRMRASWGPRLWKITFRYIGARSADAYELVFRPAT